MTKNKSPHIMDVTLRDGSYMTHFQITCDQAANIASCLDEAGLQYIEIGHGISVGAKEYGISSISHDVEYAKSVANVVRRAKIGMLALPHIATIEQMEPLAPYLDFIRIGTNIDNVRECSKFIKQCRSFDLEIFFQMIRSSSFSVSKITYAAQQVEEMDVDVIYVVDTAGRLLPDETKNCITHLKEKIKKPIGFHAHNHLGLALANSLAAIDAGCDWVDASLLGMGRGAGNAQLEALLILLEKKNIDHTIDLKQILNFTEILVRPLSPDIKGLHAHDLMAARAGVDLYPFEVYLSLARELGCEIWDIAEEIRKIPNVVELTLEHMGLIISRRGKDPEKVMKNLGWTRPKD